jgi:ribulose-bisphosphate carboxylase large chain
MESLLATFRIRCPVEDVERRAEEVAREQTTELPAGGVVVPGLEESVVGRVVAVRSVGELLHEFDVALPGITQDGSPSQLLNMLFGNVSMHPDISLHDAGIPDWLVARFPGPRFGIEGMRRVTGVGRRALTCTALKPQGLSVEQLASLCGKFAEAGIDVIKDDHGLADQSSAPFEERVRACQQAVDRAAERSGRYSVYAPNLSGSPRTVMSQLELALKLGCRAVMCAPMLLGMPLLADLARAAEGTVLLAHPSFSGAGRVAPELLLGRLMRLMGADAVIFPHAGCRFGSWSEETCRLLASRLREPWLDMRASLPVPAGGVDAERATELIGFYGADVMLLVGGSLYLAGGALDGRAADFVRSVALACGAGTEADD